MGRHIPLAVVSAALVVVLGWTPLVDAARDAAFPPNSNELFRANHSIPPAR